MSIFEDLKLEFKIGDISIKIIMICVFTFLVSIPFFYSFQKGVFEIPDWLSLNSDYNRSLIFPWTLITYQFFHGGFFHLVANMFALTFASRLFLTFFTQKQLLGVYILGGAFAGIVFVIGYLLLQNFGVLVGASASVMAVLVAVTVYQPLMMVHLPLLGHIKLWYITATIIIALDILNFQLANTGGHLAHLGGALFGFIYIKTLQAGTDLTSGFNTLLDAIVGLFSGRKSTPFKKVHKNVKSDSAKSTSRVVTKDKSQQQIDEILDKISQSGYDSLTKEEKEFLFKAGK
ncbi:rhomboid family intramembrane serine protease [Flavobacterium sp. GCM10027622]|uniref:rhomboid family intramembrane serine protease n=1 Tax=unclassified Flavobacterium TaxID=196869 RepID=UPI00360BD8FD